MRGERAVKVGRGMVRREGLKGWGDEEGGKKGWCRWRGIVIEKREIPINGKVRRKNKRKSRTDNELEMKKGMGLNERKCQQK